MRTKLKKYDKTYKELTAENAELEKELNSASRESIQKTLEIQRKLSELDELRRTVDSIPDAVNPGIHRAKICASRSNESGNLRQYYF